MHEIASASRPFAGPPGFLTPFVLGALALGPIASGQEAGSSSHPTPEPLWTYQTGGEIWSSAVHADGVLYFGSDDNCLYALDVASGEPRWRFVTGGRVRSTPALGDERLWIASDDGLLYSIARADGGEQWRFDLESAGVPRVLPSPLPPYEYDYMQSSPLHSDGTVYVGAANGCLYALDAASGEERWRFRTGGRIRSSPRASGDAVFVGSWDGRLYCLDGSTGARRWSFDTGGILQASPTIADGRVFIGSRNPKMFALDERTGELLWEFVHGDGTWVESTAVVQDGVLYVGSSDAFALFAFDAETGELLQKLPTGGWSWSTPVVHEEAILIGSVGAEPYALGPERGLWAVDPISWEVLWYLPTGRQPRYLTGGVFASPAVVDGVACVGALDGRMYALELAP